MNQRRRGGVSRFESPRKPWRQVSESLSEAPTPLTLQFGEELRPYFVGRNARQLPDPGRPKAYPRPHIDRPPFGQSISFEHFHQRRWQSRVTIPPLGPYAAARNALGFVKVPGGVDHGISIVAGRSRIDRRAKPDRLPVETPQR